MQRNVTTVLILVIVGAWTLTTRAQSRWAVIIGISTYQYSGNDLVYAADDARAVYKILRRNNLFPEDNIKLLLNEDANSRNITNAFSEWLPSRARTGDLAVIYYSGHGASGRDEEPQDEPDGKDEYLAPYDVAALSDFDRNPHTGIRDDLIAEWFEKLSSDTVVVFDSCYSGGGFRSLQLPGIPKTLAPAPSGRKRAIDVKENGMQGEFEGLPDNIVFLASSGPDQQSWVDPDLKQSVFTHYLLEGLEGQADDNGDGDISVTEAFQFAHRKIAQNSDWKELQEPVLKKKSKKEIMLLSGLQPVPPPFTLSQHGPITIDVWFQSVHENGTVSPARQKRDFRSGDRFQLSFQTTQSCYIFLENIDSEGNAQHVYPTDPRADTAVWVEQNQPYNISGTFNHVTGEERFYALASLHPFSFTQDIQPRLPRKGEPQRNTEELLSPFSYTTIRLTHR